MERYQLLSELYESGGVDALPVDLACWSQKDLNDALEYAITDKLYGLVALLLDHGAQVTECVFRRACGSKDLVVFQHLLDHGWNINSTPFGEPALRLMIRREAVVRWFLEHGADPNQPGSRGSTPLRTAASVGTLAVMKLLVAYGARFETLGPRLFQSILPRVNITDGEETLSILEYMLQNDVDINKQEPMGTALHIAVDIGDPVLMQWLLDHGADRTIRAADGSTAADWAKEMEEPEMLRLLQDYKSTLPSQVGQE